MPRPRWAAVDLAPVMVVPLMVMDPDPVGGLVEVVVSPLAAITVAGLTAVAGPWLRTVAVRVMVALGVVVAGPVNVILRSALLATTGVRVTWLRPRCRCCRRRRSRYRSRWWCRPGTSTPTLGCRSG